MARSVVLTDAAVQRFEQAVHDWWVVYGAFGKPGVDQVAKALKCDRRVVMRIRNHQPNDKNVLIALFAAQAAKPMAADYITLWELTDADFEESALLKRASALLTEAGQLYEGADYEKAEKDCREALAIFRKTEAKWGEVDARMSLTRIEIARGKFEQALEEIDCAFQASRGEKPNRQTAALYELRGVIALRQGRWDSCREDLNRSLAMWSDYKDLHRMIEIETSLLTLETRAKRPSQARTHLKNAQKMLDTFKYAPLRAALLLQEARLHLLEGRPEAANDCAKQGLDYWTFAEHPRWMALSHFVLAEIAAAQRHPAEAARHSEISLKLYTQVGDLYGAQQARQILTDELAS